MNPAASSVPPTFPPEWTAVGRVDDFPIGRGKQVRIGARRIGVYRQAGQASQGESWHALKDSCPHAGVALHPGPLKDGAVVCVGHGWRFDLTTGEVCEGSRACRVATYPVRVVGDVVEVGV